MIRPEWEIIAAWARAEIEKARDGLETSQGFEERLRGRIAAMRDLLELAEPRPPITATPRGYDVARGY